MRRLNVMHMIHHLGIGGAERVVANYARFHDRSRYRLSVCCLTNGGPLAEEVKRAEVDVFVLSKKPGIDLRVIPRIVHLLRRERIDILHAHNFTASSWGRVAARLCGTPLVVSTEHNVAPEHASLFRLINRVLAPFSDRVIAVSEKVRDTHIAYGKIHPGKVVTIYNGIDPEPYQSRYDLDGLRAQLGIPPGAVVVGIVASLTAQKAHHHFMEASKIIQKAIPNAIFLIVGDGPLRREVEETCRALGMSTSVIFAGWRKDVPALLQLMDLFVLTSLWEGCPMVILEAMAAGKPMVVTDVGGNSELIGQLEGTLVPPRDPARCAKACIALIKDKNMYCQMALRMKQIFAERFQVTRMVRNTENLYAKLLSID
jgi:glycosyltransferase involved in cell wall biosynthesis